MRRTLALWSTCLLAIACQGAWPQDADKVSASTGAVPVKRAVEVLAEATHLKLRVARAAEKETVIFRLDGANVDDVLTKLATVTSCKWVTDSNGIRWLTPDEELRRNEARDELKAKTDRIAQAIKKLTESLDPKEAAKNTAVPPDVEGGMVFQMAMGTATPAAKAIIRLARNLSPSLLATIGEGERMVFSSSPTRMQRPLGGAGNIIADLVKEHNDMVAKTAAAQNKADEAKTNEQKKTEQQMEEMFGGIMGTNATKKPITSAPTKILLIASKGGFGFGMMGDSISLTLKVYDATGAVILSGQQPLQGGAEEFLRLRQKPEEGKEEKQVGKPIKLSPVSIEFVKFSNVNPMGGGSYERNPSTKLMEQLLNPDKYDPLGYLQSEALMALANNRNCNLIANLPDSVISMLAAFGEQSVPTDEGFLDSLETGGEAAVEDASGWVTIRPAKPTESRRLRLDRHALAKLIDASQKSGNPTLDDLATYSLANAAPMQTPVAFPYLIYFAPNSINSGMKGMLNWNLLRLYGTLSIAQKGFLANGTPVSFASLLPNQRTLVEKIVFGTTAKLEVLSQVKPAGEGGFMDMIKAFLPKPSTDFKDEPTEVMPNGLPSAGQLRALLDKSLFVVPATTGEGPAPKMFGALGPDEFAMLEYLRTDPNFSAMGSQIPKIETVRAGDRTSWDFTFVVAEDIGVKDNLQDDRLSKDSPAVSVESLPRSWQDKVAARIKAFKKNPLPFGMGGGSPPPPPQAQ